MSSTSSPVSRICRCPTQAGRYIVLERGEQRCKDVPATSVDSALTQLVDALGLALNLGCFSPRISRGKGQELLPPCRKAIAFPSIFTISVTIVQSVAIVLSSSVSCRVGISGKSIYVPGSSRYCLIGSGSQQPTAEPRFSIEYSVCPL